MTPVFRNWGQGHRPFLRDNMRDHRPFLKSKINLTEHLFPCAAALRGGHRPFLKNNMPKAEAGRGHRPFLGTTYGSKPRLKNRIIRPGCKRSGLCEAGSCYTKRIIAFIRRLRFLKKRDFGPEGLLPQERTLRGNPRPDLFISGLAAPC